MTAFTRFFTIGLDEADRRLARALAPPALDDADRYLAESAIVKTIDHCASRLTGWWTASHTSRTLRALDEAVKKQSWAARYQSIAVVVITAVATHLMLTIAQGPRPGWFWMVVPSLAAVFATVVLAASLQSDR
jgi:hypothetical protein